jgi:hypothetical protein
VRHPVTDSSPARGTRRTREQVKEFVRWRAPWLFRAVLEPILRVKHHRAMRRLSVVTEQVRSRYGTAVQSGPFRGMRYVAEARHAGFTPKILGCYESEIAEIITAAAGASYDTMIDVGCAEGYYAVGFAFASPATRVIAFDTDPECQRLCSELAGLNGLESRLTIAGSCDHATLNRVGEARVFLLCDCEGYERDLLDPRAVPRLAGWDLLVELHDTVDPSITPTLIGRFSATHDITLIDSTWRSGDDVPAAAFLPDKNDRDLAVSDRRGSWQQWAWMRARRG